MEIAFEKSQYADEKNGLKNFQILEGIYTYLAYLAFVKNDEVYRELSLALKKFRTEKQISLTEILCYKRFGKNYLLYLPVKKKIFYLLYFFGQERLLLKLV